MGSVSRKGGRRDVSRAIGRTLAVSTALLGLCVAGGVQAATLSCGVGATPVRISTENVAQWSTDARKVADGSTATILDNYIWSGWFDPAAASPAMTAKWLSFGVSPPADAVTIDGDRGLGAWVAGRGTLIYNETITVAPNVDLASIKVTGRAGADDSVNFAVMPSVLPGGVANTSASNPAWPLVRETPLGVSYGTPGNVNLDGSANGLGFYYGDNAIGLAISSQDLNTTFPGGVVADLTITADCQTPLAAQPTTPLMCPVGNQPGDTVRIGPFTTNARDWKWSWRTNSATAPQALENVAQPLYDDFIWRSYFKPSELATPTSARWISPGTVNPAGTDLPGVPYPLATGQSKAGLYGSVFTMNQPILVGNNVDLNSIKLEGRFGFDDTGDSVFVQPAGQAAPTTFPSNLLPDGYGAFTSYTTAAIPGFQQGYNTIGLVLDGGQYQNDCASGSCAMAAIADFYVTGQCTGAYPVLSNTTPVPTLDLAGLGLLSLLGAGAGALAMRRRKRAK